MKPIVEPIQIPTGCNCSVKGINGDAACSLHRKAFRRRLLNN